ncbi:hypothetical protein [Jatrophihabitans lederbergiae]|uniref:Uncharacterized protein n=1 Tax=Jatrophihabitans lederbergiae TaxID=3075547 RepID=A0ABU2JGH9_9ACTN|nr:hypothetical protein [Jatrophihabitans sp. DSM 44399]MDT0263584.1 hypothetical protein [Jatrophihabitans sp. DSM 44399]
MAEHPQTEQSDDPPDSESVEDPSSSSTGVHRHPVDPVLPQTSSDERDVGWGDGPSSYPDGWYLAERPPHHG